MKTFFDFFLFIYLLSISHYCSEHQPFSHYVQNYHKGFDIWEVTALTKCETHKQLKDRETFWQHKL